MKNFLSKHIVKIIVIAELLGVICASVFLYCEQKYLPITEQIENINKKEQILLQDVENISKLDKTKVYFGESTITVTFEEENCTAKTTFDKDWNVLERQIIDNRISGSVPGTIMFIALIGLGTPMVLIVLSSAIISGITDFMEKEKLLKQKNKNLDN